MKNSLTSYRAFIGIYNNFVETINYHGNSLKIIYLQHAIMLFKIAAFSLEIDLSSNLIQGHQYLALFQNQFLIISLDIFLFLTLSH